MEHPAVVEVAVTSCPDEERGEVTSNAQLKSNFASSKTKNNVIIRHIFCSLSKVVKAFVVVTKEYSERALNKDTQPEFIKELQEHTKRITAPYKYPRQVERLKIFFIKSNS